VPVPVVNASIAQQQVCDIEQKVHNAEQQVHPVVDALTSDKAGDNGSGKRLYHLTLFQAITDLLITLAELHITASSVPVKLSTTTAIHVAEGMCTFHFSQLYGLFPV
jgi:hypothetical protein